jgi:mannitol 2-dehydrogenase
MVGVQLVQDVAPYERMKLRLLNGSHQAMAYFGCLLGHRYVHEAASDDRIVRLLTRYMDTEATPTLSPVPGIDLDVYKSTLLERFANPHIRDTLARLATDASDRIPKFLLPVVRDLLESGSAVGTCAAVIASWAVFAAGVDSHGMAINVTDRQSDLVEAAVARQSLDPMGFLRDPQLFGDLAEQPVFAQPFSWTFNDITSLGAGRALESLLEG